MPTVAHWPGDLLRTIAERASLRVRAGEAPHRFLGIWAVVVDGRVFVRSWRDQPDGWYRAWRLDPIGAIQVGARELMVLAVPVRGEKILAEVSRAYLEKYQGPGSRSYAVGMDAPARRRTTLELRPMGQADAAQVKGDARNATPGKAGGRKGPVNKATATKAAAKKATASKRGGTKRGRKADAPRRGR